MFDRLGAEVAAYDECWGSLGGVVLEPSETTEFQARDIKQEKEAPVHPQG